MQNEYDHEEMIMVKVAWYYYMENLTQQEIGEYLGIPRLRVNRLLDKARKNGVIHFSVRAKDSSRMQIERKIIQRFHLKDAFIVPPAINKNDINENVAKAAAVYIHDRMDESSFLNMGYGDTLSRVLNHLANISEFPINVVSLTGGVSYYLPNAQSSIFNAKLYLTPTPLLMQTPEIVRAVEKEPSVDQILNMTALAKMTIFGIGGMDDNATIIKNGLLNHNDFLLLNMKGAVGDMLCHFIDANGCLVPSDIEDRLISTSLDALKNLDNTIAVAAGKDKAKPILAALRGGYLDTLITDEATAASILEISEQI
ncbi:MAG: sugar-binding transcriptional regulator [Lachnospiraceae bacterium]|nr:sugar-binding transcriptional regulator [Lachnospiraceae bacterium]MDD3795544.1 sugar-binding transcriptional regulator [Lachnospiraceae bacterium]